MCGIFGQITNDVANINMDKIKILGILNETRGVQSCGITIDGDIFTGHVTPKTIFRNFAKEIQDQPELLPVVFGHTRKSSVGIISSANAHPFGFGSSKKHGGFKMIGAHNGTLSNYDEIAEHYKITTKVVNGETTKSGYTPTREKIDSEIFLEAIYKSKGFKPISQYMGGAALVFTETESGKTFLFSGESIKSAYMRTPEIERPLHVYIVDDNNMYFSSEKDPLLVIGGSDDNVFQIEGNTVYEITNGDFKNAKKHKIVRTEELQKVHTYVAPSQSFRNHTRADYSAPRPIGSPMDYTLRSNATYYVDNALSKKLIEVRYEEACYFESFKLLRKGVPVSGIFINVYGYGYFKIADTFAEAMSFFNENRSHCLDYLTGKVTTDVSLDTLGHRTPLFPKTYQKDVKSHFVYIVQGYILKAPLDYTYVISQNLHLVETATLALKKLSYMTKYPVLVSGIYLLEDFPVEEDLEDTLNMEYSFDIVGGRLIKKSGIATPHLLFLNIREKVKRETPKEVLSLPEKNKVGPKFQVDLKYKENLQLLIRECSLASRHDLTSMDAIAEESSDGYVDLSEDPHDEVDQTFLQSLNYAAVVKELHDAFINSERAYKFEGADVFTFYEDVDKILEESLLRVDDVFDYLKTDSTPMSKTILTMLTNYYTV